MATFPPRDDENEEKEKHGKEEKDAAATSTAAFWRRAKRSKEAAAIVKKFGVPVNQRHTAWLGLSGADQLKAQHAARGITFRSLCDDIAQARAAHEPFSVIDKDVERTQLDMVDGARALLRNVLQA